jgi:uncharacterized membrane protein
MSEVLTGAFSLTKHRLEALTDGIFAVAMTLLVIELKIPESAHVASQAALLNTLVHLIPKFVSWLISFGVLAIFWVSHHRLFHFVRHVDAKLSWLTIAYLACVSMMPFSSSLTGEYGYALASQVFYSINMMMLGVLALLKSRYVYLHPELCSPPMPRAVFLGARLRTAGLVFVAFVAILISWAIPDRGVIGNVAFMLMIIFGRVGRRIEAREFALQQAANPSANPT